MRYVTSLNTKILSAKMNNFKEILAGQTLNLFERDTILFSLLLKSEWISGHDVTKVLVKLNKNEWSMGLINLLNPRGPE